MEEKTHKQLGFIDCMGLGIGQIIGSGVMVLTGIVVGLTGHGTPLAFICAALLVICTMTSAGGALLGCPLQRRRLLLRQAPDRPPRRLYVPGHVRGLSQVLIATFALGFAQYFAALVPSANEKLVAMIILTLATAVNLIGIKTAASVQNIMVFCLLAALALFAIFGLPQVDWSNMALTAENIMPNGVMNFLQGVALLSFATGGAKFLAETAGEVKNAGKTVPRAMILSTIIVAVFYALLGVVASGVLPLDQVAFQNLTLVAQTIFPAWLYYFFIIGGAAVRSGHHPQRHPVLGDPRPAAVRPATAGCPRSAPRRTRAALRWSCCWCSMWWARSPSCPAWTPPPSPTWAWA